MEVFNFSEKAISKLAVKKIISIYPMIIGALITTFIIINKIENNEIVETPDLQLIFAGVCLFILIGGFFSSKKSISTILSNTYFTIDENSIVKIVENGNKIHIQFRDIKRYQSEKSGLRLKTKTQQLKIPKEINNFNELNNRLKLKINTSIINYDTKFKLNQTLLNTLIAYAMFGLILSFFIVKSKQHKLMLGFPLLLLSIGGIIELITKKHNRHYVDSSTIFKAIFHTLILLGYLIYILIFI
ncbi:hypothetical protein EGM88_05300 [Aureibaculum marinum]|uniref:Uncharacterized protein n=1 Tax=Aureibaculum marinum TaxID=2487930 RepID=A0A3N4P4E1_9FLAO|nr:hypothetical protein [Aureibaculum marinum]RPD98609.1 hypothetical protein EGM88_05300 [Aureibaculum marinum]